jgi:hypothetical protein
MTDTVLDFKFTSERRRALRVKIKSLAAEARIIRQEESRTRRQMTDAAGKPDLVAALASAFVSLRAHRTNDVRRESRYSLLAYALLRGRSMASAEPVSKRAKKEIDLAKLAAICHRFSVGRTAAKWGEAVKQWAIADVLTGLA